jgi:hypothetical protein
VTSSACLLVCLSSAGLLSACIDPGDDFDAFAERNAASTSPEASGGAPSVAVVDGGCARPDPSEVATEYLISSVVVPLAPRQPALVKGTFSPSLVGDELHIEVTAVALSAADRVTPVSEPVPFGTLIIDADGHLTTTSVNLSGPGAADSVICGADIEGTAAFDGTFCKPPSGDHVRFACGTFTGSATKPLTIPSMRGNFTLQSIEPGEPFPEPLVDCDRTTAIEPACK